MALVILPVERPLDLIGVDNGNLDPGVLATVPGGGKLHHLAARAWNALVTEAAVAGFNLTYTLGGCYRTLQQQEVLFRLRYVNPPVPGRPYKVWKGQVWSQRPGVAMAAVPGTSNHGLGLAIDSALDNDPGDGISPNDATSIAPAIGWLEHNAPRFGFSWETLPSEPWHIRYVAGDRIPQAVLDHEHPPDAPVPPQEDDDMNKYAFVGVKDEATQALWIPGAGKPIEFDNPEDRDALLAELGIDAIGATITRTTYDRLR